MRPNQKKGEFYGRFLSYIPLDTDQLETARRVRAVSHRGRTLDARVMTRAEIRRFARKLQLRRRRWPQARRP